MQTMAKKRVKLAEQRAKNLNLEEIYGIALVASALLLALFVFTQATGIIGRYSTYLLKYSVGVGRYLIPVLLLVWGLGYLIHKTGMDLEKMGLGLLVAFLSIISFTHLVFVASYDKPASYFFKPQFLTAYGGGYVGAFFAYLLWFLLQRGAYIVLAAAFIIGLVLSTGLSISNFLTKIKITATDIFKKEEEEKETYDKTADGQELIGEVKPYPSQSQKTEIMKEITEPAFKGNLEKDSSVAKEIALGVGKGYVLPPLSLLKTTRSSQGLLTKKGVKEGTQILEDTLRNFDVDAKVNRVVKGPTVTRFELQLAKGVKVGRVSSLSSDIALALASPDVRIVTPIPGKSAIGIEVPNRYRELVTLGDVLTSPETKRSKSVLTIGLGKDVAGFPVIADLAEMPHLLIAGATGSGKSVCINSILISLLLRSKPHEVKMILIDPKRIEFNLYSDIPHLLTPVVIGPKQAATVLGWVTSEMEERFKALAKAGARNIATYNQAVKEKKSEELEFLPYILVVIDELADLMIVSPAEVEDTICRIAQMARAVGIHLVVATQRPSADIITGLIKANIITRIAFAVSSQTDSRVILDTGGAEKLVGKGDMLYTSSASLKPRRTQGAFLTEQEIVQITDFAKKQASPEYNEEIFEQEKSKLGYLKEDDDLLYDAMKLVVENQMASVSMLQRRLRLGYTRAARLIDVMEDKGIVGRYEGNKPRAVLVTPEEFERIREAREDE